MVRNLKANKAFQTLCEKYDVFVNVEPRILELYGILLDKELSIEIFARELKKGRLLGLFRKNPPKEMVTGYKAPGVEAKMWSLANYIIKRFIQAKDGMEPDIIKFLEGTKKVAANK